MPLTPGTRLGADEVVAPLGAGGMGEVHRGCDTRLDRPVAIKVLPAASLVARDANLAAVARDFVDELHHEYLLGFVPAQFDGKSHKIEVKVNRSGAKARARTTYFAPKR